MTDSDDLQLTADQLADLFEELAADLRAGESDRDKVVADALAVMNVQEIDMELPERRGSAHNDSLRGYY